MPKRQRDESDYVEQAPATQSRRRADGSSQPRRPLTQYQAFVRSALQSGRFNSLPAKQRLGAVASEWRLSGRAAAPRPSKRASTAYNEFRHAYPKARAGAYELSAGYQPPKRRAASGRAASSYQAWVTKYTQINGMRPPAGPWENSADYAAPRARAPRAAAGRRAPSQYALFVRSRYDSVRSLTLPPTPLPRPNVCDRCSVARSA